MFLKLDESRLLWNFCQLEYIYLGSGHLSRLILSTIYLIKTQIKLQVIIIFLLILVDERRYCQSRDQCQWLNTKDPITAWLSLLWKLFLSSLKLIPYGRQKSIGIEELYRLESRVSFENQNLKRMAQLNLSSGC